MDTIEKQVIDALLNEGKRLADLDKLECASLIKLLRRRLKMSQQNLSKHANLSLSVIKRIEAGYSDPKIHIVKQILNAMECDLLLIPIPKRLPDKILRERIERTAKKRARYLQGTMAMEGQEPDEKYLKELLKQEIEELLKNPTNLWADDAD